jgi:hypothetical protein
MTITLASRISVAVSAFAAVLLSWHATLAPVLSGPLA